MFIVNLDKMKLNKRFSQINNTKVFLKKPKSIYFNLTVKQKL